MEVLEIPLVAAPDSEYTGWQVSQACPNAATCLEVRFWRHPDTDEADLVVLRDSTDPTGPTLEMSPAEWAVFLAGVRNGEFDLPEPTTLLEDQ